MTKPKKKLHWKIAKIVPCWHRPDFEIHPDDIIVSCSKCGAEKMFNRQWFKYNWRTYWLEGNIEDKSFLCSKCGKI